MDDQPSLSMSSPSSSLFEKPEFNETETNDVTYGAMCVVLQQDGFQSNQIEAAGIQRDGRQSLIEELANTICRITDEVGRDEEFKQTINRLKVSNEQHAYEVFRDASWNVAFRSGRAITWTRVAGLLVLAGKLASKVLSLAANVVRLIRIITSWVSRFIRDYLWSWIADSGGWVRCS